MWYLFLCAAILLIAAGVFLIVRRKKAGAAVSLVLAVVSLAYIILFPPYSEMPVTGIFAYTHTTVQYEENRTETYKDDSGNRKISAVIYYPTDENIAENSCPLAVFSHGGMGYANSNVSLYRELASHGYVVISIDHTYQALRTKIDGKTVYIDSAYMKELNSENAAVNAQNSYDCYVKWMEVRMGDINYVIDYTKSRSDNNESFYGLIDTNNIAVIGHSLGGSAALGVGRAREDITAVIALEAPFMYDIIGVENNSFVWREEEYPVPVLNIYTDSSYAHLNEWKQYAMNYRLLTGENDAFRSVYIEGANHFSVTDLSLASPILTRILGGIPQKITARESLKRVNEECLRFLDLTTPK